MNKKAQELAMHDKDTGSSEIQIALLTEKIETLSKHIKQFELLKNQYLYHALQVLVPFYSFFYFPIYLFVLLSFLFFLHTQKIHLF